MSLADQLHLDIFGLSGAKIDPERCASVVVHVVSVILLGFCIDRATHMLALKSIRAQTTEPGRDEEHSPL